MKTFLATTAAALALSAAAAQADGFPRWVSVIVPGQAAAGCDEMQATGLETAPGVFAYFNNPTCPMATGASDSDAPVELAATPADPEPEPDNGDDPGKGDNGSGDDS